MQRDLAAWLTSEGHVVRVPAEDAAVSGLHDHLAGDGPFGDGLDLVVTLGGDGSILRAVELLADASVPILGVDHGQLGYLTEVEPGEAQQAVARVLAGEHQIDERMLVETSITVGGQVQVHRALNEAR